MNRKYSLKIKAHIKQKEFTILIGARQVGKTTLLKQLYEELLEDKITAYFLSFEQPDILKAIDEHPDNLFQYIPFEKQNKNIPFMQKTYVFIDEIQYAQNPTNFLKYLYDTYGDELKIIATGSSAFYIDKNFKDSLAGRKRIFEIYTLDFDEYLLFNKQDKLMSDFKMMQRNPKFVSLHEAKLKKYFAEFVVYGGYPSVVLEKNKKQKIEILKGLLVTYIKKTMHESSINDETKFYNLLRILATQTGNLLNKHELCNTLRLRTEKLEEYLYVLQKSFHIHLVKPQYGNLRKELTKMPKVYFHDAGFRTTLLNNFQSIDDRLDKGQIIENVVFQKLRDTHGTDMLKYWRTADGNEVDFLVETTYNEGNAYEVKYNDIEFKPTKYKKFCEAYPNYNLSCISYIGKNELMRM